MREIAEMVAGIRLDEVEHRMQTKPDEYPEYTDAIETERIVSKTLLEKYEMDKVELNQLVSAVNASSVALAVEMYIFSIWEISLSFRKRTSSTDRAISLLSILDGVTENYSNSFISTRA